MGILLGQHCVFLFFFFFFSFFFIILVFLSYDKGRDTYICFPGHIMRVRFYLFICPSGTEQSILSSYCIVNLAEYLDDTWIEGIHIF